MTIQFRWSESDYVAAQVVWLRHHPWPVLRGFWYPIVILILVVAIAAVHPDAWLRCLYGVGVALVAIGFGALMTRWRWHRTFKRTPLWHDEVTATIDQQGISLHSRSYNVRHSWGEFSDIYEAGRVFVFGKANNTFVFIPKLEMGLSQIHEFRNAIMSYARVTPRLAGEMAT